MAANITLVGAHGATHRVGLNQLLSPAARDRVRAEANRWIKRVRLVRYGDATMRDRFTYRGDSLWWFTELYLHKMRRLEQSIAMIFALESAIETHAPHRIAVECRNTAEAHAAHAFARAYGIGVEVTQPHRQPRSRTASLLVGVSAVVSRLRFVPQPRWHHARVAAFVHTAFWRSGDDGADTGRESYIGPVLDAIAARVPANDLRLIGVGPRRNFRLRRWWDPITHRGSDPHVTPIEQLAPRRMLSESMALWRQRHRLADEIVAGREVRDAGLFGDYDLWPVLSAELRDAALVQWTWSARAMDEMRSALVTTEPDVAVTYAEAGGWGRALVLEARRLSIPTVGLQHGFIYRHWLNYQHEPDEMLHHGTDAGFPLPTRTLVFDRYAASTLETTGRFPEAAIAVTGSARLDELTARLRTIGVEREIIRQALNVAGHEHLLVLAAKAAEVGPYLQDLFAAVRESPGVVLVVKPHPAETRDVYEPFLHPGDRITIEAPQADLGRVLAAADAIVTMNSTVAIDGLVIGLPALVIGLPNNLSPFVDAGVMAGADGPAIRAAIATLLYDRPAREVLLQRGAAFAAQHAMRADGESARRAADDILSHSRFRS